MNVLYIGQYSDGSTSKMRADQIKAILKPDEFQIIDTHIPFHQTNKIARSFGFRYKRGPVIWKVNSYIKSQLDNLTSLFNENISNPTYDLLWIDKAIFITEKTTQLLRGLTNKMVHFTPDPAFTFHGSPHFRGSLSYYDFAITTKSYELSYFEKYLNKEQIIYATQGYDKEIHKPLTSYTEKKEGLLFIGHYEREREEVFQKLLDKNIPVSLAGINWNKFVAKNSKNKYLHYLGTGIYGQDYARALSEYQFSWGSLSKYMPELHTTRTFEIPACGTALITERNSETMTFFNEEEAIFYDTTDELVSKISYLMKHPQELEAITNKGYAKVTSGGYDYESILKKILVQIGLL